MRQRRRRALVWAALPLLTACHDYGPVHSLADAMRTTNNEWRGFAGDVAATCERGQLLSSAPAADACVQPLAASAAWASVLTILGDYVGALGSTTDDGNFVLAASYDQLGASAGTALRLDPAKTEAITGITKLLSKLAVDGNRRRSLDRLSEQSGNARLVVIAVRDDMAGAYRGMLDIERRRVITAYNDVAINSRMAALPECAATGPLPRIFDTDSRPTAQDFYFRQQYTARCADIRARLAAIDRLKVSADAMLAALDTLQAQRGKLGSKAAATLLRARARELTDSAATIRAANEGGSR